MKTFIIFCFILLCVSCTVNSQNEKLAIELNDKAVKLYHNNGKDSVTISKVIELYDQAIDADPQYLIPFWNKITLFLEQNRCNDALTELEEFQKNNQKTLGFSSAIGFILEGLGRNKEAEEKYIQELSLYDLLMEESTDSTIIDLKISRAFILMFVKGTGDGIAEFEKILNEYPKNQNLQYHKTTFYDFDRNKFIEDYSNCN